MFNSSNFENKKKIIFVGMPDTAYVTLLFLNKANMNVIAVVTPPKNHPACAPFVNYAQKLGYQTISPEKSINEPDIVSKLSNLNADIAVVTSYSQRFSKDLLSTTKDGFINVHPSLLPEYRGANPYSHVIINAEPHTGVTIHKMDENFDTGDILMQNSLPIAQNDTMGTIFNKLNRLSGQMLVKLVDEYEKFGMQDGVKQSALPKPIHTADKILPESEFTKIDWNKSAVEIERLIRGLNPFLPASTEFKGLNIKIFSADISNKITKYPAGTVCQIGNTIDVATGAGTLKIRTVQVGSFFLGDARDFGERINIQIGDKFE